jgi:hypothetical protein
LLWIKNIAGAGVKLDKMRQSFVRGWGCNYREKRLPGQPVMVLMFDQNGVEVFLGVSPQRRGDAEQK